VASIFPRVGAGSAAAGLLLAGAVLTGCGGGGSKAASSSTTTVPVATTSTVPPTTTTTIPTEYVVQKGDSLSKIAKKFGVNIADLVTLNKITNPDKIQEGQTLKIPPPVAPVNTAGTGTTVPSATTVPAGKTTTTAKR